MPPLLLLLADGTARSGRELAGRLGISRAAVWKQIDGLRRTGLEILAGRSGYRLRWPLEPLDMQRVRAALPGGVRERIGGIENHWRLDSTSSEVARRTRELPDLSFVFADWQQSGRGRRGRQWLSPPGVNLQVSCLKRFGGDYAALSGLALAVGLAVAGALEDSGASGIALKWPNDLVHADAKLGGILVELGGDRMGPCHAVIGVGVNLRLPAAMRRGLARSCTDLAGLCGVSPSRNVLAAALVTRLVVALEAFERSGFPSCVEQWAARDALAGRRVRIDAAHESFTGIAGGVDARGALLVRTAGGVRSVTGGEVTVRPA